MEASSTIFRVFGMTWPRIEPSSPGPLADTLTIMPMSALCICARIHINVCGCAWKTFGFEIILDKLVLRNINTVGNKFSPGATELCQIKRSSVNLLFSGWGAPSGECRRDQEFFSLAAHESLFVYSPQYETALHHNDTVRCQINPVFMSVFVCVFQSVYACVCVCVCLCTCIFYPCVKEHIYRTAVSTRSPKLTSDDPVHCLSGWPLKNSKYCKESVQK